MEKEFNKKLAECLKAVVKDEDLVDLEDLGKYIVGECILAILATDTRNLTYTTFDTNFKDAIISKVVDSVQDHWKFE